MLFGNNNKKPNSMKAQIQTIYGRNAEYLKADRKSDYSVAVQYQNEPSKIYWIRSWEIAKVHFKQSLISADKFCKLLLIPFKESL